ncbi:MAG: FHIPEP family type III secretion protein [Ardenticatenaceae bacterium]|nr:FHIPEP family type III secretion protein [Ardenticatenaceae bacterium]
MNELKLIPHYLHGNISREALTPVLAEAYFRGASVNEPMLQLTESLETFRELAAGTNGLIPLILHLNNEIGRFRRPKSRDIFVYIREWVYQQCDLLIDHLFTNQDNSPDWLNLFAEALAHWQVRLCKKLLEYRPNSIPAIQFDLSRQLQMVIEERWLETYPLYNFFGHHPAVADHIRGRLLVPAGQILLYFFHEPDNALNTFKEAEKLLPDYGRIQAAMSEFHIQQKSFQEATRLAEQAIELTPDEGEGYVFLGDIAEQAGNLEEAQSWFETALEREPGGTLAITRLIRLFGRPEMINLFESRIITLSEQAIQIEPHSEYIIFLEVGTAFQQAQKYDEAHRWIDKAITYDPKRSAAHYNRGNIFYDQANQILKQENDPLNDRFLSYVAEAENAFEQALSLNSEMYDPYWALGSTAELRQDWETALSWYEKIPHLAWFKENLADHPHAQAPFINQIGKMLLKCDRHEDGKEAMLQALRLDKRGDADILNLATSLSYEKETFAEALKIIAAVRQIKGDSFEASYQNRLGNAYYYHAEYNKAVEHYKKAIDRENSEPVYYTNLAGTLRRLHQWSAARDALKGAYDLDGLKKRYDRELAQINNEEGNHFFELADFAAALECYAKAIQLNNQEPVFYSNLALGWENRFAESGFQGIDYAVEALKNAIELDPDNGDYRRRITKLEAQQKVANLWGESNLPLLNNPSIFSITFSKNLEPLIFANPAGLLTSDYRDDIEAVRSWCYQKFNLIIHIKTTIDQTSQDLNRFWISLNGIPIATNTIPENQYLTLNDPAALNQLGIETLETTNPFDGNQAYFIAGARAQEARQAGYYLWTPPGYGALFLANQIQHNIVQALTLTEMKRLLSESNDENCREISASPSHLIQFTLLGQAMLKEQVPMVELPACAKTYLNNIDEANLTGIYVAVRQLEAIKSYLTGNSPETELIPVDPAFEDQITRRIRQISEEPYLAIGPNLTQHILKLVRRYINNLISGSAALVVKDPLSRIFLRQLVELEYPYLGVIARDEIVENISEDGGRRWGEPLTWEEM